MSHYAIETSSLHHWWYSSFCWNYSSSCQIHHNDCARLDFPVGGMWKKAKLTHTCNYTMITTAHKQICMLHWPKNWSNTHFTSSHSSLCESGVDGGGVWALVFLSSLDRFQHFICPFVAEIMVSYNTKSQANIPICLRDMRQSSVFFGTRCIQVCHPPFPPLSWKTWINNKSQWLCNT